jgi:hypothetical protein
LEQRVSYGDWASGGKTKEPWFGPGRGQEVFLFCKLFRQAVGPNQTHHQSSLWAVTPEVKGRLHKADYSPSNGQVKVGGKLPPGVKREILLLPNFYSAVIILLPPPSRIKVFSPNFIFSKTPVYVLPLEKK